MKEGKCQKIDTVDLAANSQEVGEEKIRANTEEEMIKELKKEFTEQEALTLQIKKIHQVSSQNEQERTYTFKYFGEISEH